MDTGIDQKKTYPQDNNIQAGSDSMVYYPLQNKKSLADKSCIDSGQITKWRCCKFRAGKGKNLEMVSPRGSNTLGCKLLEVPSSFLCPSRMHTKVGILSIRLRTAKKSSSCKCLVDMQIG